MTDGPRQLHNLLHCLFMHAEFVLTTSERDHHHIIYNQSRLKPCIEQMLVHNCCLLCMSAHNERCENECSARVGIAYRSNTIHTVYRQIPTGNYEYIKDYKTNRVLIAQINIEIRLYVVNPASPSSPLTLPVSINRNCLSHSLKAR